MGRTTRSLLLAALAIAACLGLAFAWLFRTVSNGVPVLSYHQVNDYGDDLLTLTTAQFVEQLEYMKKNGYEAITPAELLAHWETGAPLPEKPFIITFDDGYLDNYTTAFPVLQYYGYRATIFIISDYVSTFPSYLTWGDALDMQDSGLNFASHTLSHTNLAELGSPEEATHQLADSKAAIEWHLGTPVEFIAYPCGGYTPEIAELTKDCGYKAAFTVNYGLADRDTPTFIIDRIPMMRSDHHNMLRFKLRIWGAPIIAPLYACKMRLLADGHDSLAKLIVLP